MTHQECTNDIVLNYDILGRLHKGAKIAAITIIEKFTDIETQIKRTLQNPQVPKDSVEGRDYDIFVVFDKFEFKPEEKVEFRRINRSLSDLELEELFFV